MIFRANIKQSLALLSFLVLFSPIIARCESEQDKADIRNLQNQQADAWNRHDAKAYASLFKEDGDCVNVVGWWWKGRAEIEKKLTDAYLLDRKSTRLNSSHTVISYAVFCLKKKKK